MGSRYSLYLARYLEEPQTCAPSHWVLVLKRSGSIRTCQTYEAVLDENGPSIVAGQRKNPLTHHPGFIAPLSFICSINLRSVDEFEQAAEEFALEETLDGCACHSEQFVLQLLAVCESMGIIVISAGCWGQLQQLRCTLDLHARNQQSA